MHANSLLNNLSKAAEYKIMKINCISIYKNESSENKIKFNITKKNIKINLAKEMQDLYNKIFKILLKDIKYDLKWRDSPYSLIGRLDMLRCKFSPN